MTVESVLTSFLISVAGEECFEALRGVDEPESVLIDDGLAAGFSCGQSVSFDGDSLRMTTLDNFGLAREEPLEDGVDMARWLMVMWLSRVDGG